MSRAEKSVSIVGIGGVKETYVLVEHVTVDDIMGLLMQGVAAEIKTGQPSTLPVPKDVKDFLVRTHVGVGH